VIGLLGLALAGLSWRRGKAAVMTVMTVTAEPPAPDLNGHDLATARKSASSSRRRTHR
jgi:hypothetical protein